MATRTPNTTRTVLGKAALYYARTLGWPVFPLHGVRGAACTCGRPDCGNAGKHPRTVNGFKDATTDETQITTWWDTWPDANVGIPTGRASGFLVVDIDPRNGGTETWEDLRERVAGGVPSTVEAFTGGGGRHLLFAYPTLEQGHAEDARIPTSKLAAGIDFKGDGGYIVAAPSLHSSGRTYQWEASSRPGEAELAPCPGLFLSGMHAARDAGSGVAERTSDASSTAKKRGRPKKADGQIAQAPGAPLETSFLYLAFHAAGWVRERIDRERCAVVCPWAGEHTTGGGSRDSSTILFAPSEARTLGWFHCSHSHCQGRGIEDVVKALPVEAVEKAKRIEAAMLAQALATSASSPSPITAPARMREPGADENEPERDDQDERPIAQAPPNPNAWQVELARTKFGIKNSYGNLCKILRHVYGKRLAWNRMRETPGLDGRALGDADVARLREELEGTWGIQPTESNVIAATRQVAEERPFHPVQDYLRGLKWDVQVRLPRVAPEILGSRNPLHTRLVMAWFTSAAKRALEPGCKVDSALVLVGEQGFRKSTFFSVLGGDWFCDTQMDITSRDGLIQLAAAWIYEWPEIENVTTRKMSAEVKAFVTSGVDTFRPPFGRSIIQHPRSAVIVGSTNEAEFLNDPTGSRRFWIVPVTQKINIELLREWRDQLWAEAVVNLDSNYQTWLTDVEELEREGQNADHQVTDAITDVIAEWLRGEEVKRKLIKPGWVTMSDLLKEALRLEPGKWDKFTQQRVGAVMKRLKWLHKRRRTDGGTAWVYVAPTPWPPPPEPLVLS